MHLQGHNNLRNANAPILHHRRLHWAAEIDCNVMNCEFYPDMYTCIVCIVYIALSPYTAERRDVLENTFPEA